NYYTAVAVENIWPQKELVPNQLTAFLCISFVGTISMAVLIAAAINLHSRGVSIDSYEQIAMEVTLPLGMWGYRIFAVALIIACFGAALELSLDIAYVYAQGFGWRWSEDLRPAEASRFALVYTIFIFAACLPI